MGLVSIALAKSVFKKKTKSERKNITLRRQLVSTPLTHLRPLALIESLS